MIPYDPDSPSEGRVSSRGGRSVYQKLPGDDSPSLLESPIFEDFDSIKHAFTTRLGGTSPPPFDSLNLSVKTGDRAANVKENLKIIEEALVLDKSPRFLDQVHGDKILLVNDFDVCKNNRGFDAAITAQPGVPLAIKTADCLSLLLYDPVKAVIGAVHAGWRGTASGIAEKTVAQMAEGFGCNPGDIIAALGPAIGPCCYEVDEIVFQAFKKRGHNWGKFSMPAIRGTSTRWMLDIRKANFLQLVEKGVKRENISTVPYCTACREDLFFSHRRDGKKTGRQIALIMIN